MERRIYEAALEGSVISLHKLLQEDALALDRFTMECYAETPLHIAAMLGHLQFVQEILHRKPELAGELDSRQSSPLHLAAAKGYVEVVKNLVRANRDMCSCPDRCGRNPLHIAAIKGHVDVLRELVQARSEAAHAKMERGDMILHACVRFNKLEAMKFLVELINNHEFLNSKDHQGNTILHLAVIDKQTETIKFLTNSTSIEVNALNANGFTALDISTQTKREVVDWEIEELLRSVGGTSGNDTKSLSSRHQHNGTQLQTQTPTPPNVANHQNTTTSRQDLNTNSKPDWIKEQRGSLMVVATLIATIAFQVGVNPPGAVWQEKDDAPQIRTGAPPPIPEQSHNPGESIMGDNRPSGYRVLITCNTVGFIASLSIIVLMISGLPFKSKFLMWILMFTMWAALTAIALTYAVSIISITPISLFHDDFVHMIGGYIIAWAGLLAILLLVHTIRLIKKTIILLVRCCRRESERSALMA